MRIAASLVLAVALTACASATPSGTPTDDFGQAFAAVADGRPALADLQDLEDPDDETVCTDELGRLRDARADLPEPPTETLAAATARWFELAESAFFACPPDGPEISSFDDAYDMLAAIEDEIATLSRDS